MTRVSTITTALICVCSASLASAQAPDKWVTGMYSEVSTAPTAVRWVPGLRMQKAASLTAMVASALTSVVEPASRRDTCGHRQFHVVPNVPLMKPEHTHKTAERHESRDSDRGIEGDGRVAAKVSKGISPAADRTGNHARNPRTISQLRLS
jgi:hypothetical protein